MRATEECRPCWHTSCRRRCAAWKRPSCASRSTSPLGCRRSPRSGSPTRRCARVASACARRSATPASPSPPIASRSTSHRPISARKGASFDLPIALGILAATGALPTGRARSLRGRRRAGARRPDPAGARHAGRRPHLPPPRHRHAAGPRGQLSRGGGRHRPAHPAGGDPARRRGPAERDRGGAGAGRRRAGSRRGRGARLRRRPRAGARQARARDRRRRRSQRVARRAAGRRQDDARATTGGGPAATGRRGAHRGLDDLVGGRPAAGPRAGSCASGRSGRRITRSPSRG